MTPEQNALHIIHVFGAIGLVATVFYACAAAPETRKKLMLWNGILSLLVLLTGIRMWQAMFNFGGGWAIVKLVCWLVLSSIGGLAYRRRAQAGLWMAISLVLSAIAVAMVYLKPF